MNRLALGLIAGLASLPAFAEEPVAPKMTDAERSAFRDEVRAYLLENPEVLIEAMDILQAREQEAALLRDVQMVSSLNDVIFNNPNDWVGGNPNGDITLVEFMDYRCGYCRQAYAEVAELIKTDGNIRFVVKEFPILGEASLISSQFAIAVLQLHGPEAYDKAHDALMTLRGEPSPESLSRLATDLGLEAQPILERMNSAAVMQVIQDNHELATQMEITGTPAFVLKDMVMRGYAPLDVMRDFVSDARS
ncbi:DsbA family protein [Rhodobacter sp. SY28-1]|uniref:DsbA family protein n=1 Tax=Rhodobacter sp. SY28-1 TaxID=2562317 RepID=UPI0010C0C623|nr:DsbA family protein [Rhodobacter sp. SY28-1]